jgi:aminoglycoside phosphotransferase (APT) family kinase protein
VTDNWGAEEQALARWVEQGLGGKVAAVERLGRWRPAWNIDLEKDGRVVPLHARGERNSDHPIPTRIADERKCHDLLEAHGIPVPHVYGYCGHPYAMVMDRLGGNVDLTFASSDAERAALIDEYLELTRRIYEIDLDRAAAVGFEIPAEPEEISLGYFSKLELCYDALGTGRDPFIEFLRGWLHANVPRGRRQAAFITYDAFQFMFQGGRITGLIDFEVAHVGDPLMDLGALRVRDSIKNVGSLPGIALRWQQVTGEEIDFDVIDFHTVQYNAQTVVMAGPALEEPEPTTDFISYMAWYVNSGRWACEVLAEMLEVQLEPVEPLEAKPSRRGPAYRHLTEALRAGSDTDDYERSALARVARYLLRSDELGAASDAADLQDLSRLLGRKVHQDQADEELLQAVRKRDSSMDAALVWLFDRRLRRTHHLMAPPNSLLVRHPKLRPIRPDAVNPADSDIDDLPWPPGAIPGTR